MKTLHIFQEQIIKDLSTGFQEGHLRQMLALATGAGKTVVASHVIHNAAKDHIKSLFIVDRITLVDQAATHLRAMGLQVGILQGENSFYRLTDEVIVASIQTLRSRGVPPVNLIIIDESHILHKKHIDLMEAWNNVPVIGLSATPLRPDLGKYYSNLVRGPSIQWLTDNGFLAPVKAYCPSAEAIEKTLESVKTRCGDFAENDLAKKINRKELVGDIITTWKERGENRPTLVFGVDIAHSKSITQQFQDDGIRAEHIDAYTDQDQRDEVIQAFREGEVNVLSSVNVLGIGFDAPEASCAILARPTLSEALHMQQIGRVIRTAEGKKDAIILDHSGNTLRFGLPIHFEVPDLGTEDNRSTKQKRKEKKMVTCKECSAVIEPGVLTCPSCGIDRQTKRTQIAYVDSNLIEYGANDPAHQVVAQDVKKRWHRSFLWLAEHKGYSQGWAYHKYLDKFSEKPPWSWRNHKSQVPGEDVTRWIKSQNIRWAKSKANKQSKTTKQPKVITSCRHCHSTHLITLPGKGPHSAGIGCGDCGKHLGWKTKGVA